MRRTVGMLTAIGFAFTTPVFGESVLVGVDPHTATISDWREGMIEEQSFETEMSEYDDPVWFVSYMPVGEENDVKLKIIQQGEVLEELESYIPEKINGLSFSSLDAVSFVDYNQDGNTDILAVKTWGDITVSVVYDGSTGDGSKHFYLNRSLSDAMTEDLSDHTISNMLDYCGYDTSNANSVFLDDMSAHFTFGSGVGAWGSGINLFADGTFDGYYRDTNAGESGDGYNGTVYSCECHGRFGNIEKHGDYYYSMVLEEYSTEQEVGTTWITEEESQGDYTYRLKHVITDPFGIYPGTLYYIFLPGAPLSELPVTLAEPLIGIGVSDDEPKTLLNHVLYNVDSGAAFSGYD